MLFAERKICSFKEKLTKTIKECLDKMMLSGFELGQRNIICTIKHSLKWL